MDTAPSAQASWYALKVKSQHEKVVASDLRDKALEEFLPLYRARRVWCDRVREVDTPLFSGYVFCRFPYENRVTVLRTSGVIRILGFGNKPSPVTDREIDSMRRMVSSGFRVTPWPFLEVGQRVCIDRGALRGLEGILLRTKDPWRVIVSVSLLQRSVAVEIDREALTAAKSWRLPATRMAG
jgi:transcription antitermination factor NusG